MVKIWNDDVRHIQMIKNARHEVPPGMVIGTCPVCAVMVLRWSELETKSEQTDRQAYIDAIKTRMNDGRRHWLARRGLWPCGCLKNFSNAHRVGCPEYPEGRKGSRL